VTISIRRDDKEDSMDAQTVQGIIQTAIKGVSLIVAIGLIGTLAMVVFAIRYGMQLIQVRELERALRVADSEGRIRYRSKCEAAMDEKRERLRQEAEEAQDEPPSYLPPDLADLTLDVQAVQ
jgi:hypothetical protein